MKELKERVILLEEKLNELTGKVNDNFKTFKDAFDNAFKKLEDKVYNDLCVNKIIALEKISEIENDIKNQNKMNWFIITTVFTLIAYALEEMMRNGGK